MMSRPTNVVVVHWHDDGGVSYLAHGDVELIVIDDRVPSDRVYRVGGRVSMETIKTAIGDCRIGHMLDGTLSEAEMQAIRLQLAAHDNGGQPRLEVVS